jgi:hypothetical protein
LNLVYEIEAIIFEKMKENFTVGLNKERRSGVRREEKEAQRDEEKKKDCLIIVLTLVLKVCFVFNSVASSCLWL